MLGIVANTKSAPLRHGLPFAYRQAMRIALYQPEIAGNVGAILRLAACLDVPVDIIDPCGFAFSDKKLRRSGMDYAERVVIARHADWASFRAAAGRLVLMSSKASVPIDQFSFSPDDTLLMGQESAGVPDDVRAQCDAAIRIPMAAGLRSFNISVATGIAMFEALRQTGALPKG
jgi:tRNA (cytidine/uridine-2'-O-)-methyltransferase